MKTVEIKCDGCGGDLTDAGAMPTFRLELSPAAVSNSGSIRYAIAISPAIDRTYHFCGLGCLDHWRDRERFRATLWQERDKQWMEANGRPDQNGRINSWFSMPEDIRKAASIEIDATTMAAFPMERPRRAVSCE